MRGTHSCTITSLIVVLALAGCATSATSRASAADAQTSPACSQPLIEQVAVQVSSTRGDDARVPALHRWTAPAHWEGVASSPGADQVEVRLDITTCPHRQKNLVGISDAHQVSGTTWCSHDDVAGATLPGMDSSGWVAVRCTFRSRREDGEADAVFEERLTLWREADVGRAIERAEPEAEAYAAQTTWPPDRVTEYLGTAQAHVLVDEPADGAEVFSLMRISQLAPTAYLDRSFTTGQERTGPVEETGTGAP